MATANFSRDVLEERNNITGDLIDFETVIENPHVEEEHDLKSRYVYDEKYMKKQKLHSHCDWLKIGKRERCGKRCKQFYCSTHSKYINKGCVVPLPCLCCGVGVRRHNQLCTSREKKYEVEYK